MLARREWVVFIDQWVLLEESAGEQGIEEAGVVNYRSDTATRVGLDVAVGIMLPPTAVSSRGYRRNVMS